MPQRRISEHHLVKPGRWQEQSIQLRRRAELSTVSLNRDDMAGTEHTVAEEQRLSTVSLNRDDTDGAEGTAGAEGTRTTLEG
ncbi:hypothetical protein K440DRAFT_134374 [Wilcoxina mikolae CBS 423.85]|nr:hypothetical protein K440DRAFT_134374 [Wilcoxina mikolae CBS 423.85]